MVDFGEFERLSRFCWIFGFILPVFPISEGRREYCFLEVVVLVQGKGRFYGMSQLLRMLILSHSILCLLALK